MHNLNLTYSQALYWSTLQPRQQLLHANLSLDVLDTVMDLLRFVIKQCERMGTKVKERTDNVIPGCPAIIAVATALATSSSTPATVANNQPRLRLNGRRLVSGLGRSGSLSLSSSACPILFCFCAMFTQYQKV